MVSAVFHAPLEAAPPETPVRDLKVVPKAAANDALDGVWRAAADAAESGDPVGVARALVPTAFGNDEVLIEAIVNNAYAAFYQIGPVLSQPHESALTTADPAMAVEHALATSRSVCRRSRSCSAKSRASRSSSAGCDPGFVSRRSSTGSTRPRPISDCHSRFTQARARRG